MGIKEEPKAKKKTIKRSDSPKTVTEKKSASQERIPTRKVNLTKKVQTAEGWRRMRIKELRAERGQ